MKKENVLYFEGAGWEDAYTVEELPVGNCRIRTAFTNNEGKKIYLEFTSSRKTAKDAKGLRYLGFEVGQFIGFVDYCFQITDDPKIDDCNRNPFPCERKTRILYTLDSILDFINKELNCSFDRVQVLNELTGYYVFSNTGKRDTFSAYNYGDQFLYNPGLYRRAKAKRAELQRKYKILFDQQYDNTSYYVEFGRPDVLIVRFGVSDELLKSVGITEREYTIKI